MTGPLLLVAALAVLSGRVTDRTTGQPLAGVTVRAGAAHAVTGRDGAYVLHLAPGPYDVTASSHDVPPQHVRVTVGARKTTRDLKLCSTTLDFHCGDEKAPGAGAASG